MLDLAGSKLRKKLGGSLQESAAAPPSDFAHKQLQKMGWTEGTGLGKRRDGITTHIKVKKRSEQAGLGVEKAAADKRATDEHWWKDSLGDTLARIGKKNKKGSSSKKRRKEFTDEELFEATGGARFGMRAGSKTKLAKWRRTESSECDNATPTSRPISPEDADGADNLTEKEDIATDESKKDKKRKKSKDKKEKKKKKKRKRDE